MRTAPPGAGDPGGGATPAAGAAGRPRGPSLERTVPLLIAGLLLVVIVVFGSTTYEEVRATATTEAAARLRIVARQLADLSRATAAARLESLRRIAADPSVVRAARGGDAAAARELLRGGAPATDTVHAAWELWSADGTRRAVVGEPATAADEAALRRLLSAVVLSDSGRAGELYPAGARIHSWTAVPVMDGGRAVGVLAERRRVANSARTARMIRELTGQEVTLLLESAGSGLRVGMDGRAVATRLTLRERGADVDVRSPDGGRWYGARAAVPGTPYAVVLLLPERAVLARPNHFLRRALVSGAVILLAGWLGAWLLSRRFIRPLRTMTEAADAVAAGDYRQRVAVDRRDELGRLGATFNEMARRIGESHTELAHRVRQSTALAAELERRNVELRGAQEETLRAVRRTQRLQDITAALSGALEFDRVVEVMLRAGIDATDAAACDVYVLDAERTALSFVRSAGAGGPPEPGARTVPLDGTLPVAEAARTERAVYVESADDWHARGGPADAEAAAGGARAALPLVARGRPLGAMRLRFAGPVRFDAETRAFLDAVAQQCAQALDRALLYDAAVHARGAAEHARHAAQSASRAKSAFLAMMSHELRTPLNAIAGYTELLSLGIRGPVTDAQREDLVRIRRNQQHLLSIINDLLNLTRIEAGQVAVRAADVPVHAVLTELEALAGPQLAAKGMHYRVVGVEPGIAVRADAEKLSQVLLNLVTNAVRFTDPGGTITVSCAADADTVHLRVTDTGIGIPPDKLEAIFEPFVQVDAGFTRRTGGTGLGLSISRDLVAAMGGRITVESEIGRGSTFTVTLPRAALDGQGSRAAAPAAPAATAARMARQGGGATA